MTTQNLTRPSVRTSILSNTKQSSQVGPAFHSFPQAAAQGDTIRDRRATRQRLKSERAARLCALADFLATDDRVLLRWIYAEGRSTAQIAALLAVRQRSVQRRIRRLVRRCLSPEFAFIAACAGNLRPGAWSAEFTSIAVACILQGRNIREVAFELDLSMSSVRTQRAAAIAMARGLGTAPKPISAPLVAAAA